MPRFTDATHEQLMYPASPLERILSRGYDGESPRACKVRPPMTATSATTFAGCSRCRHKLKVDPVFELMLTKKNYYQ